MVGKYIFFFALKCFEKAVLDFFSLLGPEVLLCTCSDDSRKTQSSAQTNSAHRALPMADTLHHFPGGSMLTVANRTFLTAKLKGAEGVSFERGREAETPPSDLSLAPGVGISSAFVVWCCRLPVLSMSCFDQLVSS